MLGTTTSLRAQSPVDSALASYIARIRAVDNHTHVNSVVPADSESDALPLDGLVPFPLPERLRPDNPAWIAAYRALYGYRYDDLSEPHLNELRATMKGVAREQGPLSRMGARPHRHRGDVGEPHRDGSGTRAASLPLGVVRRRADAAAVHDGRACRESRLSRALSARGAPAQALPR